jgi:asparagine synthetase B (glutamine-hydrolysing)
MMAWGVEPRVPFLDVEFLDVAMNMDAAAKMAGNGRMEKAVLREAISQTRSFGGRRSSSAMEWATAG